MKAKQTVTGLSGALVLHILLNAVAYSATYYVATSGNDSNVGSSSQPFRTISKGATKLVPGDTLIVRGGTYVEPSIDNKIPGGSSWSAPVTVLAYSGETVNVQPTSTGVPGINISKGKRFIRINGLGLDMARAADTDGIKIHENASDIELLNLDIRNISGDRGSAIVVGEGSQRVTVRDSKVHDVYQTPVAHPGNHGLYWRGSYGLIENNEIYNVQGWGIQFYSTVGSINDNIVRNNVFRNVGQPSLRSEGGIIIYSGVRNKIYGNLIYNSYGSGIAIKNNDNQILNNTVYKSSATGIDLVSGNNNIIKNNITFGNGSNFVNHGSGTVASNNLTTDPMFVDSSNANFRLKSGSPAIDKGETISAIALDLDGTARPIGTGLDIGAYEYRSTTTTTATSPSAPSSLQAVAQ